ncbi:MAG: glutamate--tRNA ligase [Minisyncoccales bacterium]
MISFQQLKFIKNGEVRTRLAPSPTGFLHLGTARTALFNYLFAKKHKGSFILRIEDTDQERSSVEFERDILENLRWLGLQWDEGPDCGGPYGSYRQSERIKENVYGKYIEKLLKENKAYYCFCSEEELENQRQYQLSQGLPPRYNGRCLNLPKETIKKYLAEGRHGVIRFKMPNKKIIFHDLIRGDLEFDAGLIGDIVIAKDIKTPLYNLAVVVDDYEMKITHIIRGEDHLPNTPKQILLQEALGLPPFIYAHLPLILGPDKAKLSKRHGATAVAEFKKMGYLPETMINFMAFLGWHPEEEKEIYSLPSLIKDFSLERIQKAGAVFNIKKLDFLNGFYIRQRSIKKLTELCLPYLVEAGLITPVFKEEQYPPAYGAKEIVPKYKITEIGEEIKLEVLQKIISLYQDRLKKLSEISQLVDFFFRKDLTYDKNLLKWREMSEEEVKNSLKKLEKILISIKSDNWRKEIIEKEIITVIEKLKLKDRGILLWPFRVALTGKKDSAGPFEIAEILGKEKTLNRIRQAQKLL